MTKENPIPLQQPWPVAAAEVSVSASGLWD